MEKTEKITRLHYTRPAIQKAILDFARNREVVPRYGEGFGKRPDTLQYPSDINGLVNKGATSFHASEEYWQDPLKITTDLSPEELTENRTGWDLLIDIDSPYLDYSKIALSLVLDFLESKGVSSYGVKFSGNKGFHIIVPFSSFPLFFKGQETKKMFPEWPRAIVSYLMEEIRPAYNRKILSLGVNFKAIEQKTKISKEELLKITCPKCGKEAVEQVFVRFVCPRCKNEVKKIQGSNRKLKCIDPVCPGYLEEVSREKVFKCTDPKCGATTHDKTADMTTRGMQEHKKSSKIGDDFRSSFTEELSAEKLGSLDLVLVSSRHLFRMPYSLHEKTGLVSAVISKDELSSFTPRDADYLKVKIRDFLPSVNKPEATRLLEESVEKFTKLEQKKEQELNAKFEAIEINPSDITEADFPSPIKKLLQGLKDGRKRGLFVLLTFLRSINYPPDRINKIVHEWNKKNQDPLREGYVRSQLDWHFKQKRKILPPNYSNASFYKDLGLFKEQPPFKNPLSEVARKIRKSSGERESF